MASALQRYVVVLTSVSLVACTSLQQLPERNDRAAEVSVRQAGAISVGDTLKVIPKEGVPFEITVVQVTTERLVGTHEGQNRTVLFSEVASFEQRRLDVLRTSLVVLGLLIIALGQYARAVGKLTNP